MPALYIYSLNLQTTIHFTALGAKLLMLFGYTVTFLSIGLGPSTKKSTEVYTPFSTSREKSRGLELGYRSAWIENTVGDFEFMPPKYSFFYPLR